ncbi:MAG TPA: metallophosphoesterase, partial [Stellaceae bacterium]|nr:metallophosphoesterase [Stellaceae bacterium]
MPFRLVAWATFVLAMAAQADTAAVWTEATGQGQSLRAVVSGECPTATVDGSPVQLTQRIAPDATFPYRTCQAALPAGTKAASIDDHAVPVRPAQTNRIVVLGDTGCRLKDGFIQDCNDPVQWPFAAVAAHAAAEKPDLVIHVGDYYYRETPCPAARKGCAGSPFGDAWPSWEADFFTPAKPLLAAAPWVFVRGNHEQCGRGAAGWFRFLDAGAAPLTCPAASQAFVVPLDGARLYVLDSADTEDDKAPAAKVALFRHQLDALEPMLSSGTGWVLTHRPIWGFTPERSGEVGETDELPVNKTEQAAAKGEDLDGIQLIVSGHVHFFAATSFGPGRPAQLIVGNGGDIRDGEVPEPQSHRIDVAGMPAQTFVIERFGY